MDPVEVLRAYCHRRAVNFGKRENFPLFLHENGLIYSKKEFNEDLSSLLSIFPELHNDRDSYSGHSFRAGLSTVLSVLGFSKDQIQSWGRWKSDAYLRYIKDQSQRRNTRAKLMLTFDKILKRV